MVKMQTVQLTPRFKAFICLALLFLNQIAIANNNTAGTTGSFDFSNGTFTEKGANVLLPIIEAELDKIKTAPDDTALRKIIGNNSSVVGQDIFELISTDPIVDHAKGTRADNVIYNISTGFIDSDGVTFIEKSENKGIVFGGEIDALSYSSTPSDLNNYYTVKVSSEKYYVSKVDKNGKAKRSKFQTDLDEIEQFFGVNDNFLGDNRTHVRFTDQKGITVVERRVDFLKRFGTPVFSKTNSSDGMGLSSKTIDSMKNNITLVTPFDSVTDSSGIAPGDPRVKTDLKVPVSRANLVEAIKKIKNKDGERVGEKWVQADYTSKADGRPGGWFSYTRELILTNKIPAPSCGT